MSGAHEDGISAASPATSSVIFGREDPTSVSTDVTASDDSTDNNSIAAVTAALNAAKSHAHGIKTREELVKIMDDAAAAITGHSHLSRSQKISHNQVEIEVGKRLTEKQEQEQNQNQSHLQHQHCRQKIEDFQRLSKSILWKLMMDFYEQNGISSWSQGIVPHFITSNAFIGKAYARILSAFLLDLHRQTTQTHRRLLLDQKLYIVEIGGGSGKFSFHFLKALEALKPIMPFPIENIIYVLTDFTDTISHFWQHHPALQPFIQTGRLDFAKFDAVHDHSLNLQISGTKISKNSPTKNPICLIANYVIDTLCHDLFQVDDGILKEGLVSVGSSHSSSDVPKTGPELIKHLDNEYLYKKTETNYYEGLVQPSDTMHYQRILSWYQEYFKTTEPAELGASILMPIGFLTAIRRLSDLSIGNTFIITGDKGSQNPELFRGLADPHLAMHGSFSLMVNFHALKLYCISRGGLALHCNQEEATLQVCCFVIPSQNDIDFSNDNTNTPSIVCSSTNLESMNEERISHYPVLQHDFHDFVDSFSPHDFFVMQKCLKEESKPSFASVLSILKLSNWDAEIFFKFRDSILTQVASTGYRLRSDLSKGIPKIWDNYYYLDNEKDVAFEIARVYYSLRRYPESFQYYEISSNLFGEHHVTYHNMGLCQYSLNNPQESLSFFRLSLKLCPSYEKAANWIEKVEKELIDA